MLDGRTQKTDTSRSPTLPIFITPLMNEGFQNPVPAIHFRIRRFCTTPPLPLVSRPNHATPVHLHGSSVRKGGRGNPMPSSRMLRLALESGT
jgi:hypothetical protein